jgi:hypothetical protein
MRTSATYPRHLEGMVLQKRGFWGQIHNGEFYPVPVKMGGGTFGTLSTLDTLAATQQSLIQYGEDRAFNEVEVARQAHNDQMQQLFSSMVERTQDRQRRYGSAVSKNLQVADQMGRPQAQKITAGVTLGWPLRLYEDAVQWTRKFMSTAGSAQQLAAEFDAILDADARMLVYEMKSAFMNPINYTFTDVLVDNVDIPVKRLVNADGASIPLGPSGTPFNGATHTHYLFTAGVALAAPDLAGLISTVLEHSNQGQVEVWINSAQETAVRGLTGFVADIAAYVIRGGAATSDVTNAPLDMMNPTNRRIGMYGAAVIYVRPWQPAGYLTAVNTGATEAPLVYLYRDGGGALQLVFDNDQFPLRARGYEHECGIGVYNRVGAAVLYIDTGAGGVYVAPTLVQ